MNRRALCVWTVLASLSENNFVAKCRTLMINRFASECRHRELTRGWVVFPDAAETHACCFNAFMIIGRPRSLASAAVAAAAAGVSFALNIRNYFSVCQGGGSRRGANIVSAVNQLDAGIQAVIARR